MTVPMRQRSEYVERRLAELGVRPRGRPMIGAPKLRKPRVLPYSAPPRPDTIDRIGALYVADIRSKTADRPATWFDVAQAYAQGWKDAETVETIK